MILLKLLVLLVVVGLVIYGLASFNIFFTLVEPGTAKVTTLNKAYFRTIFNFKGYGITPEGEIRRVEELEKARRSHKTAGWFRRFLGGLYFIGPPPFFELYRYTLRWGVLWRNVADLEKEIERSNVSGTVATGNIFQRSEVVEEFYLKATPYALLLTDVEDVNKIKTSIVFVIMASVRNPSKAAFRVNNWWTAVSDNLLAQIRPWVGQFRWEDIKSIEEDLLKRSDFRNVKRLVKLMTEEWGIQVMSLRIDDVVLPTDIEEAATRKYVAEQEADATRVKAAGEADAIRTVAAAEQERITTVFAAATAHGDDGVAMKIAEDLSRGAKSTWVIGAKPLAESLRDLTKGKES